MDHKTVQELTREHLFSRKSRRAFVAPSPLAYGLSRMFISIRQLSGGQEEMDVFKNRDKALWWLFRAGSLAVKETASGTQSGGLGENLVGFMRDRHNAGHEPVTPLRCHGLALVWRSLIWKPLTCRPARHPTACKAVHSVTVAQYSIAQYTSQSVARCSEPLPAALPRTCQLGNGLASEQSRAGLSSRGSEQASARGCGCLCRAW
jgi:hypothetical protein